MVYTSLDSQTDSMNRPQFDRFVKPAIAEQPPLNNPFNNPLVTGRELDYIRQALASKHIAGDGPFTKQCQAGACHLCDE